jgi:kumamolisin
MIDALSTTFHDAAILGQNGPTIFVASGDTGSESKVPDGKAHVQYPATDPWVTACGGTAIDSISGSSFREITWNDTGATGGGISDYFSPPTYQNGVTLPPLINDGHKGRGVPDVAGNASPNSGFPIKVDGIDLIVSGTSAVAPPYAGLVALINATLGQSVGFLNPILYSLGLASTVFSDINDGRTNALYGAPGYKSGPVWDACTRWGSINGAALLAVLQQQLKG